MLRWMPREDDNFGPNAFTVVHFMFVFKENF